MKVQISHATYCTVCAYAKGICAVCGKQVLDTSMYKMSGGTSVHVVRERDEAKFKSPEQLAREKAQQDLLDHLQQTGQTGRMPTKAALDAAGQRELAAALLTSFGGLHAAAVAMGLSTRLLSEEAEARKQAKRAAAMQAAEADAERRAAAASSEQGAGRESAAQEATGAEEPVSVAAIDENDLPPGVALKEAADELTKAGECATAGAMAGTTARAPATATTASAAPSTDATWKYDPNVGLYFQLSTQSYYDHSKKAYFKDGRWRQTPPARKW